MSYPPCNHHPLQRSFRLLLPSTDNVVSSLFLPRLSLDGRRNFYRLPTLLSFCLASHSHSPTLPYFSFPSIPDPLPWFPKFHFNRFCLPPECLDPNSPRLTPRSRRPLSPPPRSPLTRPSFLPPKSGPVRRASRLKYPPLSFIFPLSPSLALCLYPSL